MRLWAEALDIAHGTRMKLVSIERLCRGVTAYGGRAQGGFQTTFEQPESEAVRLICQIAVFRALSAAQSKGVACMKAAVLALIILMPVPVHAEAIDQLLASKCGGLLQMDMKLMNDGAREAYAALLASWILFTDASKVDPPLNDVCDANPNLTVEEAMREAIARVTK